MATKKSTKTKVDGTVTSTKTIEEKAESKSFFNARNIIIIIFTSLLSLGLVVLTVMFVLKMDWGLFFGNVKTGLTHNIGWLWLSLLILFVFVSIAYNYIPIWIRLKKLGIKVKAWQYFVFALSISFLKGVTPSNFIYDPYTIFWMKTQGVSTAKATSIMFSNALLWQAVVLLIHIPSFIIVMMQVDAILAIGPWGVGIIVLMCIGLFVDIVGCLVMFLLSFSKRAHYVLSSIFNWVKKKLHLKYHTKAQIEEKYKNRATLKNNIISFYKEKLDTGIIICVLLGYELIVYFIFNAALELINPQIAQTIFTPAHGLYSWNVWQVFNGINMALNANRINILPGFAVGLEFTIKDMIVQIGQIVPKDKDTTEFVSQGMFVWRTFYTYFPTVLGLFGFGGLTIYHIRSYKKKKGGFIATKYE